MLPKICERDGCGHSSDVHLNFNDLDNPAAETFECQLPGCGCPDMIRELVLIEVGT